PAVAFFITTTSKSLILAVGYQLFTSHADTENSRSCDRDRQAYQ
ncbi:hypothetical protein S1K_4956, partial [Escherichia coli B89]